VEEAFEHVVQLDEDCDNTKQELENMKIQQLVEMGFADDQTYAAIQQYNMDEVWVMHFLFCCSQHSGRMRHK
jgi:hypothetical protein